MLNFNKLAQNEADKRLQKTVYRYIFFFLSFTSLILGGLILMGNNLFSKTDEFSKGGLCDRYQFVRVPYFFEGPVPNLALLQCHESDNQRASCVSCRVVNVVCLCAKQKHKHSTVSRRKRYQMGRPYKPYIKHIGLCSKYYCFQSRIVLLKAFSLYICF